MATLISLVSITDSYAPFHLHSELAYCIKGALNSSSRSDPNIKIELPFDRFLFIGGLQQAGKLRKSTRIHEVYGVTAYSALAPLLGEQWQVRVLNKQMDFCYVIRDTIQYYLRRRPSIIDPIDPKRSIDGGYSLVFRFVRGDGVQRNWENIISLD